jgi:hypothetical protein
VLLELRPREILLELGVVVVTEARGQFGKPEGRERPPLEAVTKQRSENRGCDHYFFV